MAGKKSGSTNLENSRDSTFGFDWFQKALKDKIGADRKRVRRNTPGRLKKIGNSFPVQRTRELTIVPFGGKFRRMV